jgi:hypothetical protein
MVTGAWFARSEAPAILPLPVPELPPVPEIFPPSPLAVQPVEPEPVPVAPIAEPALAPEPALPLDRKYNSVLDAAAGYFIAHPSVRFVVETNGSRRQAELVVEELQKRGILKERVVRIDTVKRSGAIVFEFIVVDGQSGQGE